ncbi:TPA: replication protein RepB, partial [Enterococcus faecium]|nr:replication protein RepB [Enterococcus faecium]
IIDMYGVVNAKELRAFLNWRGTEFGVTNLGDVEDVLSANGSLFRFYFDGNYQNGFRPQYAKRINSETGEIISGVDELISKTEEGE